MSNIPFTEDEFAVLCAILTGKTIKKHFQKQPKQFAKIKPGFRWNGISDTEAISIAVKNKDSNFISSFVVERCTAYVKELLKSIDEKELSGAVCEEAIAGTLLESEFCDHVELYFKLSEQTVDDTYVSNIKKIMEKMDSGDCDEATEMESWETDLEIESLKDQITALQSEIYGLKIYELKSLQSENATLVEQLDEAKKRIVELQTAYDKSNDELQRIHNCMQYDDVTAPQESSPQYEYRSICEVSEPDYSGQQWLKRLADISIDGSINVFFSNDDLPKYFGNRSKLFHKDGPCQQGRVAVWEWSAIPNQTDQDKDYVITAYNGKTEPIEVITFPQCGTIPEVLEQLKSGVNTAATTQRVLFAAYLTNGKYTGVLCSQSQLETTALGTRLKNAVFSLPQYEFENKDCIRLRNNKFYFRKINIGVPSEIVRVKEPLTVVKDIILSRTTWSAFKQIGASRNDWRTAKDFLEQLDVTSIVNEISDSCMCSHDEAQALLNQFIATVNAYICGDSIEDQIISAVISKNSDLMERCKTLLMDDWQKENADELEKLQKQLAHISAEIQRRNDEKEKITSNLDARERDAKEALEKLKIKYQDLVTKISEKEQFADEVEDIVSAKIKNAQKNAAEFVASMAFLQAQQASISTTISESENSDFAYNQGIPLDEDGLDEHSTWKDTLETIKYELIDAGVAQRYAAPCAAYLFSAYLHRVPVLLIGPNAAEIADAFCAAVFGSKAGTLDCSYAFHPKFISECRNSDEPIIKILEPFNSSWISRLPEIICSRQVYFYAVHPYAEDVLIEPKSLYQYMMPIFTDLFVDETANGKSIGGHRAADYEEFTLVKAKPKYTQLFKQMHVTALIKNRIYSILANMHCMLNEDNIDYDILFALLPYSFATMQSDVLLKELKNTENRKLQISKELLEYIENIYGDAE